MFGIFSRAARPLDPAWLESMSRAMPGHWAAGVTTRRGSCAGCCPLHSPILPEAYTSQSDYRYHPASFDFSVSARLDNREELSRAIGIPARLTPELTDLDLVRLAYSRWGEECAGRIFGDWSFAAWHPEERRLFLARDHFGNTAVYYHADSRIFAFAPSYKPLVALNLFPVELDELYLAQVLISWPAYHGERTIRSPIRRLPPAHSLRITPEQLEIRCYWHPWDTPDLRLPRREDYITPFLEHFDQAVRARLRLCGEKTEGAVAAFLSGGLDSGAVTATAARMLVQEGRRLTAFTSVPLTDTGTYVGERFGDEFHYAGATARFCGNVDHYPVPASALNPVAAIRRMLDITGEPGHGAGNAYWCLELERMAGEAGARVLLTGAMGNGGVSWTGDIFSQPLFDQLTHFGWRKWLKERTKRCVSRQLLTRWRLLRLRESEWLNGCAIHPDFARRLRLLEHRLRDPDEFWPCPPPEARVRILMPGRSAVGAFYAALTAACGMEYRDPTADPRLLAFCLSVPDHVFIDPQTGMDRWLIREAMRNRLPDEVRLNRSRGRQAGDLVPRLRACAPQVEDTLAELAAGPAAAYLDVPHMRRAWHKVLTENSAESFRYAITVLLRGIMAGLFVNRFFGVPDYERNTIEP